MSFIDDTREHINDVRMVLEKITTKLALRGKYHDYSKLTDYELPIFQKVLDHQESAQYGTSEYEDTKKKLAPALEHHYKLNSHHPEHFPRGINDMTLVDILEMLADWKAATKRHKDDRIESSIEINAKKYNIDKQLKQILLNTLKEMED